MGDAGEVLTTLKLLIIGESGVGKSSLLLRFTDDAFDPEQAATIVSCISKSLTVLFSKDILLLKNPMILNHFFHLSFSGRGF